jgi:dephospho-CoA kinase
MSFRLGLTGSIGMGKSTTARMFADEGCAVWDADAAVHRLYAASGAAVAPMAATFPEALVDGVISRERLRGIIMADPSALKRIESIVHPLLAEDRKAFVADAASDILVFDIPLLFETGGNAAMDAVACVSISPEIHRDRVLSRGTMTEAQFLAILAKQMPIEEKIARSDFVIVTDTPENALRQVREVIRQIRERIADA